MKSVIDAVNELRGDLRLSKHWHSDRYLYWFDGAAEECGVIGLQRSDSGDKHYKLICSIDDFNQCVAELSAAEWIPGGTIEDWKAGNLVNGSLVVYWDDGEVMPDFPIKPVFTQEMADAGELPMVGSECLLSLAFSTFNAMITYMGDGVGCFKNLGDGKELAFSTCDASFKPIKTEREKAICAAADIIAGGDGFIFSPDEAAKRLYDAGLLTTPPKQG